MLSPPPPPFLKGKHAHRGFFPSTTPYPYPHKYQQTACRLSILARGGQPKNRISKSRCALFGASASGLRERRGGRGIVREGLSWANGSNNLVRFSPLRNLYSLRWWVDVSPVSCCALFRLNSDQDPRELKGDSSVTGLGWSGVDGVGVGRVAGGPRAADEDVNQRDQGGGGGWRVHVESMNMGDADWRRHKFQNNKTSTLLPSPTTFQNSCVTPINKFNTICINQLCRSDSSSRIER